MTCNLLYFFTLTFLSVSIIIFITETSLKTLKKLIKILNISDDDILKYIKK